MSRTVKKRNDSIDMLRALAALMVVFLHFLESDVFGIGCLLAISRIAVPLFFCISGYFYGMKKDEEAKDYTFRQSMRLLRLLLVIYTVSVVKLLLQAFFGISEPDRIEKGIRDFLSWPSLLLNFKFAPIGWFVRASIYLLFLYSFVLRKLYRKHRRVYMTFIALLVMSFPLYYWYLGPFVFGHLVNLEKWEWLEKYIGSALCYFTIGMYFGDTKDTAPIRTSGRLIMVGVIAAVMVNCCERFVLVRVTETASNCDYLMTPVITVLLFILAIGDQIPVKSKILTYIGRYDSMYIYAFHIIVAAFWERLFRVFGMRIHQLLLCLLIYLVSILAAEIYRRVMAAGAKRLPFLRWFVV